MPDSDPRTLASRLPLALSFAAIVALALLVAAVATRGTTNATAHFVGSASCGQCHPAEHEAWRGSHHAAAMQGATEETVLGRFDGATFAKDGIDTTFSRKDGRFVVRTDGPDGSLADFEVKYTFGIAPLQQYLIELPGGRLQAFGIAWDARPASDGGGRWYDLYPDRKLMPGDPLHWTGLDQNWNYQCAWCHSTNLKKNYDRESRTFKTEWSEISVGCETCHGPASSHLAWAAKSAGWEADEAKGFDVRLGARKGGAVVKGGAAGAIRAPSDAKEILVCAGCHARREQFADEAPAVQRFSDAFRAARIEPGLYYADGQQRDEVYNHGSFLQSRMHAAGVTCSDCHNPHSGKLRESGNRVCTQCHAPERFDAASHHHHATGSSGGQCAACHMPTKVYMGVDARHDHSIRIPRPDRTLVLGTPNACRQCHADKPAKWAADAINTWYPSPKPGAQTFAEAFDLGDRGAPGAQAALIRVAEDTSLSGLVRASAIIRLAPARSLSVVSALARAVGVDDPDVRSAAIEALAGADPATRAALVKPLLRDQRRVVRMDAAHVLAGEVEASLSAEERREFDHLIDEYVGAQLFNAERPEAQANLGSLYLRRGDVDQARRAYEEASRIDPTFYPAAIALADLAQRQGSEEAAEAILRRSIALNPASGPLQHALGLSLVRQKRIPESMQPLAAAVRLAPDVTRFAYVLAVAEHDAGNKSEAHEILAAALVRHPYDRDLLLGLISYELEARDFGTALSRAELYATLEPERADIRQLISRLKTLGGQR
jgi:predicted CXXCH cytochrome family protein